MGTASTDSLSSDQSQVLNPVLKNSEIAVNLLNSRDGDARVGAISPGYSGQPAVPRKRTRAARPASDRLAANIGRATRHIGFKGRAHRGRMVRPASRGKQPSGSDHS